LEAPETSAIGNPKNRRALLLPKQVSRSKRCCFLQESAFAMETASLVDLWLTKRRRARILGFNFNIRKKQDFCVARKSSSKVVFEEMLAV